MDDRDSSATAQLERLGNRFGEDDSGDSDDADSSEKPFWKRYGAWLQALVIVATAFGGAIVGIASTAVNRTTNFVQASGPALLDTFIPILAGVTLIAVAVCLVVVALGVRNV